MNPRFFGNDMNGGAPMYFHFRKEVRAVLFYWLLALGAIGGVRMLSPGMAGLVHLLFSPFCVVLTMMLGAASFGSEFQYRTMPLLLLQPLERAVLWRSKMIVLGIAMLSLVATVSLMPVYFYPMRGYPVTYLAIAIYAFGMLPWLTLVAGDGLIGAGLTFAVGGVQEIINKAIFDPYPSYFSACHFVFCLLLGIVGYCLGRRAFMRWESFPPWRPRWAGLDSVLACRVAPARAEKQSALAALVRKEFHLQTVSILFALLFCLGFVVIVPLVRVLPDREPLLKHFVQIYCATFPVIAGAVSVAGERQLGLLDWHLSLPISVARQFLVKMGVCLALGLGVGFLLPWALLRICGESPAWFPARLVFLLVIVGTTIGVCASSLQTGTLRAAVMGLTGLVLVLIGAAWLHTVFIHRGVYAWFYSEPSWLHFTWWGVMLMVLSAVYRLAFHGYRHR